MTVARRKYLSFLVVSLVASLGTAATQPARDVRSFDPGWRFIKGDEPGAEVTTHIDSGWRALDVPHDWSIEGPFGHHNADGGMLAWLPAGVGWYRKHFTLSEEEAKRRVFVEFDGVMANSEVWINGVKLGKRPYGYVSFLYELTDHLNFGSKENVLAVRVDNASQPASRWYTGAGIYRHVRLVIADPVHLELSGPFVTANVSGTSAAQVNVRSTVANQSKERRKITVRTKIQTPEGKVLPVLDNTEEIEAGATRDFSQQLTVEKPELWDVWDSGKAPEKDTEEALQENRPAGHSHGPGGVDAARQANLYQATVQVVDAKKVLDSQTVRFGIREARFEASTGFWLNGRNMKIKGACVHHDGGPLGAAVPLRVWERRLELLRSCGVNAIRTAHNPVAPEFLDLCDRMGFLVVDEFFDCWLVGKKNFDYHVYFQQWHEADVRDTVRRDRNHPCVILYSVGNEIHDTPNAELAKGILGELIGIVRAEDPWRPVTMGLWRPEVSRDYQNGLADMLDVVGQTYYEGGLLKAHAQKPSRKILGLENSQDRFAWLVMRDNPAFSGQFLWSAFDYLGDTIKWGHLNWGTGFFDRTGKPYPRAFERQSWWSAKPMVYVTRSVQDRPAATAELLASTPAIPANQANRANGAAPEPSPAKAKPQVVAIPPKSHDTSDWTPRDTTPHDETVNVFSNCEEVELLLNGKSLGSQSLPKDASPRKWTVPFESGTLQAMGKNKGEVVTSHELRTAGKASAIKLVADRLKLEADWDDVCFVTASIVDEEGVLVPDAGDLVNFKIAGNGGVVGIDNGDRYSLEPFQGLTRHAFNGQCVAVIKATGSSGTIKITATAEGLEPASVVLQTTPKHGSTGSDR